MNSEMAYYGSPRGAPLLNIQNHTSYDTTLPNVNEARFGLQNLNNLVMVETTKPGPTPPKLNNTQLHLFKPSFACQNGSNKWMKHRFTQ